MPFMPSKERFGKPPVAEQMIVEEVEMASGQPLDLGQRIVDPLGVEAAAALKEGVFVAEVAVLRTSARHDDGVGHEIVAALDEIAADRRHALQRAACCGGVDALRLAGAKVCRNCGKVCSPGPRKMASAWAAASSGSEVTCSPPRQTKAPRAR